MKVGSAIVHYANEKSMEEARDKFNLKLFGEEQPMELDVFLTKKDREQKGMLFITNIKPDVDVQTLVKLFAEFGKIEGQSFNKTVTRAEEGAIQKGTITYETKYLIYDADKRCAKRWQIGARSLAYTTTSSEASRRSTSTRTRMSVLNS